MGKAHVICFILFNFFSWITYAQEDQFEEINIPSINLLRAEEFYQFVDTLNQQKIFLQPLKWIPISRAKNVFLTLGGEYRARFESFTNKSYTSENDSYYSQRLDVNASLHLGYRIRFFGELYHGRTSGEEKLLEDDFLDLHQGFLEVVINKSESSSATLRLGRQEIGYGASRLVGIREGPNMRRSFDLAKFVIQKREVTMDLFYGKEVSVSFNTFDNESNFFNNDSSSPSFWGAYYRRPFLKDIGKLDLYYFGFHSHLSKFNDTVGEELRHSIGIRSFSIKGRLSYNTEVILQFGELDNSRIFAYNFETDWKYKLVESGWKPTLGIKMDRSSGDKQKGDGKVGTFNPLFVNPAIYSLAAVNTPANITSLHPNFTFHPIENLSVYVDYALFYRTQSADGLYAPPRFLSRESNGISTKHIGDVFGLQIQYEVNRNISFDLRSSYFISGKFIENTGASENTFYIAPTISFKI